MHRNVPDDWNMYWRTCDRCGARYHASDGGCDACVEMTDEDIERAKREEERDNGR